MRITDLRRFGLATVLALALALLGLGQPAGADTPDLTFSSDQASVTPGSTVNLTMTLTNNQATDIWFVYQSVQPTWPTTQRTDLKYAFTSCTSEGVSCTGTGTGSLGVNYAIPLAPGASRTVTLAVQIAADSGCNGTIGFYSYLYYEYNNGQTVKDGIFNTPGTTIACATPAQS
ncbi:hypothetical protein [Streptomyces sp. NPDC048442]|uniref:hypothetical protein n=1 Tax=Streptomyces sp. NPDC048442 TaxID=3154823 RepID=UPI003446D274